MMTMRPPQHGHGCESGLGSFASAQLSSPGSGCAAGTSSSWPSRWRQRVSDERSKGTSCWNTVSPQKYWKYGFSTHRSHSASSDRLCMCLRMSSPATSRVGNGGCPGPIRQTELKRPARPINLCRQTHQRMAKVDDLIKRWAKQIVLTIVARLAHGFPPTANLLSKAITKCLNPESQNARKSRPAPGFLAKSNTCSRQITAINQRLPNTSRTTVYFVVDAVLMAVARPVANWLSE